MDPNKALVDSMLDKIINSCHPISIILFGSAARGEMNDQSDLDLLVVMPNGTHRRKTAQGLYRQLLGVGFAKDIIVATEDDIEHHKLNPYMIYQQALRDGRELYHAG